ncbi:uncharacterized protein LOC134457526 [Engraulis encrasicolus]|uniref:uncharacterized protein LOC134457526 n=1 Tax=Engraulis encrasicolus TaxID=184585 RepID=UPI002FD0925A
MAWGSEEQSQRGMAPEGAYEGAFESEAWSNSSYQATERGGDLTDEAAEGEQQDKAASASHFSIVRPASGPSSSHQHHTREDALTQMSSTDLLPGSHRDEGQVSKRVPGHWVSQTDLMDLPPYTAGQTFSQEELSNLPVPPKHPKPQKTWQKKKFRTGDFEDWIDQEIVRQRRLLWTRRQRQWQVQERRSDMQQRRQQWLEDQPYHALCGKDNTGPDGPSWCPLRHQHWASAEGQRPGDRGQAQVQQSCDRGQDQVPVQILGQGLSSRSGTTPQQFIHKARSHTQQGSSTDTPYRHQMPFAFQSFSSTKRPSQGSRSLSRVLPVRPCSSPSIPSKGQFVLTHFEDEPVSQLPSQLEERLLRERFPGYHKELTSKGVIPLHTVYF